MRDLIENLNIFLADLNVFYRKLQNYHWNIEGKDFFIMHEKLEEYYDEVNKSIDEIAEHILTLNAQPLGTLKDYIEIAKIKEADNKKVDSDYIVKDILKDFKYLLDSSINIKKMADDINEYATSAIIDEYINDYCKKIWMIKQMER